MFIGIDLHKDYLQTAVLDRRGKLVTEARIQNEEREIEKFFLKITRYLGQGMRRGRW
jgi:hypothetical protein